MLLSSTRCIGWGINEAHNRLMNASLDVCATSIGSQGKGIYLDSQLLMHIENEWGGKIFSIRGRANTFKFKRRNTKLKEEEKESQHSHTPKTLKNKPTHIISTISILTKSTSITLPSPINIMLPCTTSIVKAMVVV